MDEMQTIYTSGYPTKLISLVKKNDHIPVTRLSFIGILRFINSKFREKVHICLDSKWITNNTNNLSSITVFLIPLALWTVSCTYGLIYGHNEPCVNNHNNSIITNNSGSFVRESTKNITLFWQILNIFRYMLIFTFELVQGIILIFFASEICFFAPYILSAAIATCSMYYRIETYCSSDMRDIQIFDRELILLIGPEMILLFLSATLTVAVIIRRQIIVMDCAHTKNPRFYLSHIYAFLFGLYIFIVIAAIGVSSALVFTDFPCLNNFFILIGLIFVVPSIYSFGRTLISNIIMSNYSFKNKDMFLDAQPVKLTTIDVSWMDYWFDVIYFASLNAAFLPIYWNCNFNPFVKIPKSFCLTTDFFIIVYIPLFGTLWHVMLLLPPPQWPLLKKKVTCLLQSFRTRCPFENIRVTLWNIFLSLLPLNTILLLALRDRYAQYTPEMQQRFVILLDSKPYYELVFDYLPIIFILCHIEIIYNLLSQSSDRCYKNIKKSDKDLALFEWYDHLTFLDWYRNNKRILKSTYTAKKRGVRPVQLSIKSNIVSKKGIRRRMHVEKETNNEMILHNDIDVQYVNERFKRL